MVKNRKIEHYHHRLFRLVYVPNFRFNRQFWFFWPDLSKKGFSGLKQKKWTPHIFYIIVHIQIRKFSSNWQLWFFGPNLPKKGISSWKQNKQSKDYKRLLFRVVNINSTVVFKHFEDLKDIIILNILKEKLVMSCLLGSFYLKTI